MAKRGSSSFVLWLVGRTRRQKALIGLAPILAREKRHMHSEKKLAAARAE